MPLGQKKRKRDSRPNWLGRQKWNGENEPMQPRRRRPRPVGRLLQRLSLFEGGARRSRHRQAQLGRRCGSLASVPDCHSERLTAQSSWSSPLIQYSLSDYAESSSKSVRQLSSACRREKCSSNMSRARRPISATHFRSPARLTIVWASVSASPGLTTMPQRC